ncbi:bile acid:sodium symporter family protein [Fundidesulfovibrio soli]|uniref:bile acid:sodium symporter family protein n=1 Tax=Fundidesulfovibrio soli TaxID=2922716 RepID=UPI001FAFC164|nr:bile acid:sodium symporter family protein [Fundidesulfovibrio soli]
MIGKALRKMAKDWFLVGMISAVVLATLFPWIGKTGGAIHADKLADWGICSVFLLHGLGLSTEKMWAGMSRWKLHLTVQLMTFAMFPLLWLALDAAFGTLLPPALLLGFFYLCALPSTISSSVAMTGIAKGNVPGAIFNATLSSLLGVFLTPLLISFVTGASGEGIPLGQAIVKIATLLLLPFMVGQGLRPFLGTWFDKHKKTINPFDKCVILLLVFSSFCDSVVSGLWTDYGVGTLGFAFAGAALILAVVLTCTTFIASRLGFCTEDRITAVMCGSKKTLASGVPMAKMLFGAHPALGLIVLPIMFYHQLQLFACSILADRYARRVAVPAAE